MFTAVFTALILDGDGEPVNLNNKGTGIAYDGLQLLMLHSYVLREAVFNCELVSTSAE